ncbi:MAG: CPBP family intramembrane metalloprotease [Spirochaetia bacterium]|nr:CPBP family intramembrane metalloprotease [Spirochaetia bacterium]
MISEKSIKFLKSIVLPAVIYLFLFNPLYSEQDQHISLTIGSILFSVGISAVQLAIIFFVMIKFNHISLKETGLFSFSYKNLLELIPSILLIYSFYFVALLVLLIATGSAEDPGIITIELHAPLWILALMMLGVGYCEELFFRIYLVEAFGTVLGKKAAILISALLFALGHMYQGFLAVIIIFFIALAFHWIYEKYRSLHVNAITHAVFDVVSVLLNGV